MPKMNHKNVVRYYSCWIEAMEPESKDVTRALRVAQQQRKMKKDASRAQLQSPEAEMTITDDEEIFTITQEDEKDTVNPRDNYTDEIPPESSEEEP